MRVIDGDGHFTGDTQGIARYLPAPFNDSGPRGGLGWFPPLDHFHAFIGQTPPGSFGPGHPEDWFEFMDDVGIESTVLYGGLSYGKVVHRDWAIALARAYNDWFHEAFLSRSARFKGMALIPMQEPEAAVEELRRAVEKLRFCGAMLPSTGFKDHLGAKEYWPVYEEANRLGCAIAVHGGAHGGFGFDHMNVYTPVGALGHPFGLLIHFGGMLFNGLFDRFPDVKFGFLEGGVAWFLLALERFERAHETHVQWNPRGELAPGPGESVIEYIRKHVKEGRLFVGCEGGEPALAYAVSQIGSEAFVYSSDFPHEVNNQSCKHEIREIVESPQLMERDKENILHRNAERVYGLAQPAKVAAAAVR